VLAPSAASQAAATGNTHIMCLLHASHQVMDKVKNPSDPEHYTPSSEPYRICTSRKHSG
jgi:hypothetical protein